MPVRGSFGGELYDRSKLDALEDELIQHGVVLYRDADEFLAQRGIAGGFHAIGPNKGETPEQAAERESYQSKNDLGRTAEQWLAQLRDLFPERTSEADLAILRDLAENYDPTAVDPEKRSPATPSGAASSQAPSSDEAGYVTPARPSVRQVEHMTWRMAYACRAWV